jgi:hypothetical protein
MGTPVLEYAAGHQHYAKKDQRNPDNGPNYGQAQGNANDYQANADEGGRKPANDVDDAQYESPKRYKRRSKARSAGTRF